MAQFQTGEADLIYLGPGPLVDTVKSDPRLKLAVALGSMFWLEMPGWEKPESPFNNLKVRQAASLALNRQAISDAEYAGFAQPISNWVPDDWPGGIKGPPPEEDPAKAKQLMPEAGFPNGFEVEQITPITGFETVAERIITQLREIGIRTKGAQGSDLQRLRCARRRGVSDSGLPDLSGHHVAYLRARD